MYGKRPSLRGVRGMKRGEGETERRKTMMVQSETTSTFFFFLKQLTMRNEICASLPQPTTQCSYKTNKQPFISEYTDTKAYIQYINTDKNAHTHKIYSKPEPATIGTVCFGLSEPL